MDIPAFNKSAAKSFNQQKALIKKVLSGKPAQCPVCSSELQLSQAPSGFSVSCQNKCTDIELEANSIK